MISTCASPWSCAWTQPWHCGSFDHDQRARTVGHQVVVRRAPPAPPSCSCLWSCSPAAWLLADTIHNFGDAASLYRLPPSGSRAGKAQRPFHLRLWPDRRPGGRSNRAHDPRQRHHLGLCEHPAAFVAPAGRPRTCRAAVAASIVGILGNEARRDPPHPRQAARLQQRRL